MIVLYKNTLATMTWIAIDDFIKEKISMVLESIGSLDLNAIITPSLVCFFSPVVRPFFDRERAGEECQTMADFNL